MKVPPIHTCIDQPHLWCAACNADPGDYAEYLREQERQEWAPTYRYSLDSALSPLEQDDLRYQQRLQRWADST